MRSEERRHAASHRWLAFGLAGWVAALTAGLGCRRQQTPQAPAGAIYYTGPKQPKGGAGRMPGR